MPIGIFSEETLKEKENFMSYLKSFMNKYDLDRTEMAKIINVLRPRITKWFNNYSTPPAKYIREYRRLMRIYAAEHFVPEPTAVPPVQKESPPIEKDEKINSMANPTPTPRSGITYTKRDIFALRIACAMLSNTKIKTSWFGIRQVFPLVSNAAVEQADLLLKRLSENK